MLIKKYKYHPIPSFLSYNLLKFPYLCISEKKITIDATTEHSKDVTGRGYQKGYQTTSAVNCYKHTVLDGVT